MYWSKNGYIQWWLQPIFFNFLNNGDISSFLHVECHFPSQIAQITRLRILIHVQQLTDILRGHQLTVYSCASHSLIHPLHDFKLLMPCFTLRGHKHNKPCFTLQFQTQISYTALKTSSPGEFTGQSNLANWNLHNKDCKNLNTPFK